MYVTLADNFRTLDQSLDQSKISRSEWTLNGTSWSSCNKDPNKEKSKVNKCQITFLFLHKACRGFGPLQLMDLDLAGVSSEWDWFLIFALRHHEIIT